ncbi:MAG: hypothetical protein V4692_05045, partial [Bdellovibrionota bacterium]
DNADKTNPLKSVAHEVFEALFSSVARPGFTRGPGLSSKSNLFGQQIVLMDNRSFRDPVNAPNANLQWGTTQEDWLMNSIGNQANPAFVINGGQFFGAYLEKDSMEYETPNRLKQMIARLRDIQAPVMFGSGDVHFSELMRLERELLGYESYELTSSSIHSTNYKFANMRTNNSRRLASAWQHNFMMIETDASRASLGEIDMKVGCIGNGLLGVEGYFAKKLSIRR